MPDLREHFARKATGVGAVVTSIADPLAARDAAGHDETDRVVEGLFAVAETGSGAGALPREERGAALLPDRPRLLVPATELVPAPPDPLPRTAGVVRARR